MDQFEDLYDVGDKAKESIENLGSSDVGDLVLEIEKTVRRLREDADEDTIDHLEGLLGELARGKEYGMRDAEEDDDVHVPHNSSPFNPPFGGALSGAISGIMPSGAMPNVASGLFNPPSNSVPIPVPAPAPVIEDEEEEWEIEEDEEEEELPKKWWRTQEAADEDEEVIYEDENEELADD